MQATTMAEMENISKHEDVDVIVSEESSSGGERRLANFDEESELSFERRGEPAFEDYIPPAKTSRKRIWLMVGVGVVVLLVAILVIAVTSRAKHPSPRTGQGASGTTAFAEVC